MYHLTHHIVTPFVHTSPAHVLIGFNSSWCNSRGPHLVTGSAPFNIGIGQLGASRPIRQTLTRFWLGQRRSDLMRLCPLQGGKSWGRANLHTKRGLIDNWPKHNMEDTMASFIMLLSLSANRWPPKYVQFMDPSCCLARQVVQVLFSWHNRLAKKDSWNSIVPKLYCCIGEFSNRHSLSLLKMNCLAGWCSHHGPPTATKVQCLVHNHTELFELI